MGDVAREIREIVDGQVQKAETGIFGVGRLDFEAFVIDGIFVNARDGAGFETVEFESEFFQRFREFCRGRFPLASCRDALLATVDDASEEGSGGEYYGARCERFPILESHAGDELPVGEKVGDDALADRDSVCCVKDALPFFLVEGFVALRSKGLHRRTFFRVQPADMDARTVGDDRLHAAERVDLAGEMTLGRSSD